MDTHDSLDTYLREGNLAAYDVQSLPSFFKEKRAGRTKAYEKGVTYANLSELREERADVYFLDRGATRVLFANFPATARFVLVRLVPRLSWGIALPGLVRRVHKGLVSVEGIRSFETAGIKTHWLVLRHNLAETLHTRLSLSEDVGVQGFLDYLRETKANAVVLRFFEALPSLARDGGDLDLLVADEDEREIKGFLKEHPGPIGVDVWTVSRTTYNDITYYPPPLARQILASAIDGPAGSRIPAPREAFLALAYHALYHKGLFAGIPTTLPGVTTNTRPENDYAGTLSRMAKDLGIEVSITMEALDEYLEQEGWRPKIDTLAKIAPRNRWVWKRFFSRETAEELGLGVIIVKRRALHRMPEIIHDIEDSGEFRIIHSEVLSDEAVVRTAKELRGGVWTHPAGAPDEFLPAGVIVVLDEALARASKTGLLHGQPERGIKHVKRFLRKKYDDGEGSSIHSTDNTEEAWIYVRVCLGEEERVRTRVMEAYESIHLTPLEQLQFRLSYLPRFLHYRWSIAKRKLRDGLVRLLLS